MLERATVTGAVARMVAATALAALSGCATASSSVSSGASGKPLGAGDYYPLSPGWKWAYDLVKDDQPMLATYAVLERTPDTAIVQAGEERLAYAVTPDGIARKEGVATGDFLIRNPIALGAAWPVVGGSAKIAAVGQTITVPSGDVYTDCVVVETLRADPARLSRTTFAPGVGPVVVEMQVQQQQGGRFVTTLRATLRAVTKPGEDPFAGPAVAGAAP